MQVFWLTQRLPLLENKITLDISLFYHFALLDLRTNKFCWDEHLNYIKLCLCIRCLTQSKMGKKDWQKSWPLCLTYFRLFLFGRFVSFGSAPTLCHRIKSVRGQLLIFLTIFQISDVKFSNLSADPSLPLPLEFTYLPY